MPTEPAGDTSSLPPDEAFSALGNETRMEILQTLGEAEGPLGFSDLRDSVGVSDSGQFNYHLDKLAGQFVRKVDDGYVLRQAGQRVIEAVLSGAVTETVVLEPTSLDAGCPYCGSSVEVSYHEERLLVRCSECVGSFGGVQSTSQAFGRLSEGTISLSYLPSAGFQGRSPRELLNTTNAWTSAQALLMANGICPRCSGGVDHAVLVCPDHRSDGSICDECKARFAVTFDARCSICGHNERGAMNLHLLGDHRFRSFFEARGVDLLGPTWDYRMMSPTITYEEEVLQTNPLEVRFSFTVAGDELVVTVDEELKVIDIVEPDAATDS